MAKRTRVFLLVAAGVLVAGLATGLVAWSMGVPVFAALGSNVPDELAYVPDDAHLVAYADLRQVMNSPLRSKLEQLQRDNPSNADGLEARTGINLETDIDRVVAAMSARTGDVRTDRPLLDRARPLQRGEDRRPHARTGRAGRAVPRQTPGVHQGRHARRGAGVR